MDRSRFGGGDIATLVLALWLALASLPSPVVAQFGPLLSPSQAPQARSQDELDAYLDITTTTHADDLVKEVNVFVSRFPKSELCGIAYQYQMHAFAQLNNFGGMLAAGRKALLANPDNLETLLTLAPAMADHGSQEPHQANLLAEAEEYARRALQGIEKTQIPRKLPLEHWDAEKRSMQAQAHEVLGVVTLKRGEHRTAVEELETAVRLDPDPPGVDFLRLGLAYASADTRQEAEKALRRAADLGPETIRKLALNELETLAASRSPLR